jgi:DNA-binding CsgD family transcriptional regulator
VIARQLLKRLKPRGIAAAAGPTEETPLSTRESEVLGFIAKGFSFSEIARLLGVSQHTVISHMKRSIRSSPSTLAGRWSMRPVRWGSSRFVGRVILRWLPPLLSLLRAAGLVLAIALVPAPTPSLGAAGDALLQLDQADFILSDSPEPPPDSVAWRPQTLPDNWLVSRPGVWGYGW